MFSLQSIAAELQEAVAKLNAFSKRPSIKTAPSPISKTKALMRSFLSGENPEDGLLLNENAVLEAVDIIQRRRLFLPRLEQGSLAEQKIAQAVKLAVEMYNPSREVINKPTKGIKKIFSKEKKYYSPLPKIDLLRMPSVKISSSERDVLTGAQTGIALSKQSIELFQMKVLALLEKHEIASNCEARDIVKRSPIHTVVKKDSSTCTLTQTLSLFPGQTITVMGVSALDIKNHRVSKLYPESFSLSIELMESDIPHAIQYSGWAMPSQLLPESPQRIDLLKHSSTVFVDKKRLVANLVPKNLLLEKAKKMMRLKTEAFALHRRELLDLHARFMHAFVQCGSTTMPSQANEIIQRFYQELVLSSSSFETLSSIHQHVCSHFVAKPHQKLLEMIYCTDLIQTPPEQRYYIAHTVLCTVDAITGHYPQHVLDYMNLIGPILGRASASIILQYLSEDLAFAPPQLTLFEKRLQAMAYQQMKNFIDELNQSLESNPEACLKQIVERLRDFISADIAFLNSEVLTIPDELEAYFEKRAIHLECN